MGIFFRETVHEVKDSTTSEYSKNVRSFLQSKDVEDTFETARPYIISSLVAWPLYWLYKGLEWPSRRGTEALPMYIRKTFFQAKLLQLFIISTGIIAATYQESENLKRFLDYRHN